MMFRASQFKFINQSSTGNVGATSFIYNKIIHLPIHKAMSVEDILSLVIIFMLGLSIQYFF